MTPMYPEELAAAKDYMRIEDAEEDLVVQDCVLAARAYLAGAGVALPGADDPRRRLYDIVAHALALATYEHRDMVTPGAAVSQNPMLRSFITQLKLTELSASNLDAGEEGGGVNASDHP